MPTTIEARILPVWGTAVELAASPVILGKGERWFRTDAPTVTDPDSPFYNKKDPAKMWKTGDGTKTWTNILDYDPVGSGGGSGSIPTLNPMSVFVNTDTSEELPGESLRIKLLPGDDPDEVTTLGDILGIGDVSALSDKIGLVSDAEALAGGLRGIVDAFQSKVVIPAIAVTGTITSGSPTVTVSTPLDSRLTYSSRVFLVSGSGIPSPAYINAIASDRLSFTLTSAMFVFTPGSGAALNATASGSRSLSIVDPSSTAFGIQLSGIPTQNVYTGIYSFRSTPNALQTDTITGETTQARVKDGILSWRAAQVAAGAWEQLTGATDLVLMNKQYVAPAGVANYSWALTTGNTEFALDASPNWRHRFRLLIPDASFTQFQCGVDTLFTASSGIGVAWVEFLDPVDSTWKDVTTTSKLPVAFASPTDASKLSAVGTLTAAALAAAAAASDRSIYCRVLGTTTVAGTAAVFNNFWTLVK